VSDLKKLTLGQRLFVALQYILPHHLLSAIMRGITRISWKPFKNKFIKQFIKLYQVDMDLAIKTKATDFNHFNDFFTRELKPESRPLDKTKNTILSPVDGAVSEFGKIESSTLMQAKGIQYSLSDLLDGNQQQIEKFKEGYFLTIYLSPKDYHRIHMPIAGKLSALNFIKGRLFSVNTTTTRLVPRLFARNERLLNLFDTEAGNMALIMVGAIFVSSMQTVYNGVANQKNSQINTEVSLNAGQEMGRFNMGSTVILLFEKDKITWSEMLEIGKTVKMGEKIGVLK